jgi:hypothetical protein
MISLTVGGTVLHPLCLRKHFKPKKIKLMNKIITALVLVGLTYSSANAQKACGSNSAKVCRATSNHKSASCYKTKYAENFKVCKGDYGYSICCESPSRTNSTQYSTAGRARRSNNNRYDMNPDVNTNTNQNQSFAMAPLGTREIPKDKIAPQSQSYPIDYAALNANNTNSYEGYYQKRGEIRVCYYGDNVAQDNLMPYQGCPSPQYDGPEKNAARNINSNTPTDLPPINGWGR